MAPRMTSRIVIRAARACFSAAASTDAGMPSSLVSSCSAVITCSVPATLKSMSPKASSAPRMSVSVTNCSPSWIRPMAIPDTMSFSGTPASSSAIVEAQTEPLLGERAVPDLAALRRADPAGLPGRVGRHVVAVHVALGALGVERVDHLLHAEHVQRAHAQDLRLAPLEQSRAVHPRQHVRLGAELADVGEPAAIHPDAL